MVYKRGWNSQRSLSVKTLLISLASRLLAGLLPFIFVILLLFFVFFSFTAKMHSTLHFIRPQYHFQKNVTDIVSILVTSVRTEPMGCAADYYT